MKRNNKDRDALSGVHEVTEINESVSDRMEQDYAKEAGGMPTKHADERRQRNK